MQPTPTEMPQLDGADLTLQILQEEFIPENNPSDLVTRLGGKQDIPATDPDPNAPYDVGASKSFWVTNVDTNQNFEIDTTLQYADDRALHLGGEQRPLQQCGPRIIG